MTKNMMSVSILICILLLSTIVLTPAKAEEAEKEVELIVYPNDISINTTETRSVKLTVLNNQDVEDTFSISVWPSTTWSGITPNLEKDKLIKMAPHSNKSTSIYFSVASSADEIITTFLVSVNSINYANVSDSGAINVRIVRKTDVYISDLASDKYLLNPADCVNITTTITNFGSDNGPYKMQADVKSGSFVMQRFENFIDIIEGKTIKSFSNSYCFDTYTPAGTYTIETTLKTGLNRFVDSRSVSLRIKESSNLIYDKTVTYNPFAQMKKIIVKNEGNVVEKDFYVTETVSDFVSKFFYPEDEPSASEHAEGRMSYKWIIASLAPGETKEIKYEIRFFSIWFSGLVLVIVVFFAFSYVYKPRISKSVAVIGPLKKGKEMAVTLEIRNSTINEIKNVIVTDTITPIASLVERFDTMKPDLNKNDAGIEMTWKIKALQPLEERVLTYRIKPVVDIIGSMRLPSAIMSYVDNKKEKKSISSKSVEIK